MNGTQPTAPVEKERECEDRFKVAGGILFLAPGMIYVAQEVVGFTGQGFFAFLREEVDRKLLGST